MAADLQTQLAGVLTFNDQYPQDVTVLNAATSATAAADIYMNDFERPGLPGRGQARGGRPGRCRGLRALTSFRLAPRPAVAAGRGAFSFHRRPGAGPRRTPLVWLTDRKAPREYNWAISNCYHFG